ncbi:MAG: hypothetical protein FJX11_15080 [Alphaproteobacteria bacterium]|nr:hypothetical protein [Alphaproteobacteria bacterium]
MCDYSLELYRSRPAARGEQYTLHRFPSGTLGFVAGLDCNTAVCLPADARLRLEGINEAVQRAFDVGPAETAVMTRLDAAPHAHRDAVRFANGHEVLLQSLNAGITAEIAALPSDLVEITPARDRRELVDA